MIWIRTTILAAAAATFSATSFAIAEMQFEGWRGPKPTVDCHCRHKEGRAEIGETVCILRGSERVLARCEKPVNLPFWNILADKCAPKTS